MFSRGIRNSLVGYRGAKMRNRPIEKSLILVRTTWNALLNEEESGIESSSWIVVQ